MTERIPTEAIKAVITNEVDEILFLQRNPKLRGEANWDLPGGLVEKEEPEKALERELLEELGVRAIVGAKRGEWQFHRPLDGTTVHVTNYECSIDGEIVLSDEHVASAWVPRGQVRDLAVKDTSLFTALGE